MLACKNVGNSTPRFSYRGNLGNYFHFGNSSKGKAEYDIFRIEQDKKYISAFGEIVEATKKKKK
jgi:hypothetical protein